MTKCFFALIRCVNLSSFHSLTSIYGGNLKYVVCVVDTNRRGIMIMIMRISVIIEKDKDNGDEYTDDDEDQNKEHLYEGARWQGVLLLPMHM